MDIYRYELKLLDAVYYAREGLAGAITPPFLHATAMNGALAAAMNCDPENQPLLLSDRNGGRNRPRYADSRLSSRFYTTAASPVGPVRYRMEIAKGENDGFLDIHKRKVKGLRRIDTREQPLRYARLFFLAPETVFEGYFFLYDANLLLPELLRLGSFRAPARVRWQPAKRWRRTDRPTRVDHPVDPLVAHVRRGIFVNMLPYGLVTNAIVDSAFDLRFDGLPPRHAACHRTWFEETRETLDGELTQARESLEASASPTLTEPETARLLMHALKTLVGAELLTRHSLSDDSLAKALQSLPGFGSLRSAVAQGQGAPDEVQARIRDVCRSLLAEITEPRSPVRSRGNLMV